MVGPEGISRPLLVVWAAQLDLAVSLIILVAALVTSGTLLAGWLSAHRTRGAPLTLRSSLWLALLLVAVAYCVASIVNAMNTLDLLPAALFTHQDARAVWAAPVMELLGVAVPSLLAAVLLAYLAVGRWLRAGERTS